MPSKARPALGRPQKKKQNQYRMSDDDDEGSVASKASYSNVGGVLASLSSNFANQTTTKRSTAAAIKCATKEKLVKPSLKETTPPPRRDTPRKCSTESDDVQSSEMKPPLSSVVLKNCAHAFSPPSTSPHARGPRPLSCRRRIFNDEVSAVSCDVASPLADTRRGTKVQASSDRPKRAGSSREEKRSDEAESQSDQSSDDNSQSLDDETEEQSDVREGEEESGASSSYSNDDTVPLADGEIEEGGDDDSNSDEENDDGENVAESESDEEFEFEDEEFVPDENSDDDDPDESEDELDDFIVEETPPKKRTRPQRKVANTPSVNTARTSSEADDRVKEKCTHDAPHMSLECTPQSNCSASHSLKQVPSHNTVEKSIENGGGQISLEESPAVSHDSRPRPATPDQQDDGDPPFDDDDTEIEETPAKVLNPRRNLKFFSPEAQVAMIVDDDDSDIDDGLVATIVEENSESFDARNESTTQIELNDEQSSLPQESMKLATSRDSQVANKSQYVLRTEVIDQNQADDEALTLKPVDTVHVLHATQTGQNRCTQSILSETTGESSNKASQDRHYRQEGTVKRGKWILGAKIGVGSFGQVHVGMNKQTGVLMAVKRFRMEEAVMKDVRTEVELLRSVKHKNIVRYFGAQMDKTYLHIFQEWVPGGSVSSLLSKFGSFSVEVIQSYLSQTLSGLLYLHKVNIMHRDLKGSNILVNDEGIVKLADFGASKKLAHLEDDLMMSLTVRGTPYFMAPEVFEEKYSAKADIWGIGCVAFQMATSRPPWKDQGFSNPISLFNHIKKQKGGPPMQHPESDSFSARQQTAWILFEEMVRKCFDQDPTMRPSAFQLLNDPFFLTVHEDDDDESVHRGLFSPGSEPIASFDCGENSPMPHVSSISSLSDPKVPSADAFSPAGKLTRSKSVVLWKTSFLSPPRPKKKEDRDSPTPCIPSQQTPSHSPDTSQWPDWARAQLTKKRLSEENSPKKAVADVTNLMGSLALSEDSTSAETRREKSSNRSSTFETMTAHSKLLGLNFLEERSCPTYDT